MVRAPEMGRSGGTTENDRGETSSGVRAGNLVPTYPGLPHKYVRAPTGRTPSKRPYLPWPAHSVRMDLLKVGVTGKDVMADRSGFLGWGQRP